MHKNLKIGFIGQGWIGKNYANDFERRGFQVVRYGLEQPYFQNKELIKSCDVVFVAVPTPTTKQGFDYSIVDNSLSNIGDGKIAVIKSTILPGTTEILQGKYPNIFVMHSPEFLREIHAAHDAENPTRNIVGIPKLNSEYTEKANIVMSVLPKAPYNKIMQSREAELVKYIGNCFLFQKVVFFNLMYDLANRFGLDYKSISEAVSKDERIGSSHMEVVHASGHSQQKLGRGAGGHCFIKDFESMIEMFKKSLPEDTRGYEMLMSIRNKNNELLVNSKKDLDLLGQVVGDISEYEK